jgi:hypothetical protein
MTSPVITLAVSDTAIDALADRILAGLLKHCQLGDTTRGYMAPKAAADYLGVQPKRIYDLKSAGALVPDGYDGRKPLFTRETLDRYVQGTAS